MRNEADLVLSAISARDIDAFVECYASEARIESDDGTILADGHDEIRLRDERMFERFPNVTVRRIERIETGPYIVQADVPAPACGSVLRGRGGWASFGPTHAHPHVR